MSGKLEVPVAHASEAADCEQCVRVELAEGRVRLTVPEPVTLMSLAEAGRVRDCLAMALVAPAKEGSRQ